MATQQKEITVALEKILDHSLEGLQVISFDWRYLYVNATVAKQGRQTKERLRGHTMMEMYPGIEKTDMFAHIRLCMEKRVSSTMETEFTFPDGSKGWFELRMEPVPEGVLIFSIEINNRKAIEQEKSEFIAIASHALRTPLGVAKWYLEAIKSESLFLQLPETIQGYLNEVYKSNERLLALVRNLLSVSRIDHKDAIDEAREVDVKAMLQKIMQDMELIADKNHIALHLVVKIKKDSQVIITPLRLQEVLENLLSNAIKYNIEQGKVMVTLTQQPTHLTITVADTGIGIAKEDQKRLFSKFFRSDKATRHNTEGSGLGLYVVKSYVDDWHGKITLQSQEGKGSTFSVFIPLGKLKSRGKQMKK